MRKTRKSSLASEATPFSIARRSGAMRRAIDNDVADSGTFMTSVDVSSPKGKLPPLSPKAKSPITPPGGKVVSRLSPLERAQELSERKVVATEAMCDVLFRKQCELEDVAMHRAEIYETIAEMVRMEEVKWTQEVKSARALLSNCSAFSDPLPRPKTTGSAPSSPRKKKIRDAHLSTADAGTAAEVQQAMRATAIDCIRREDLRKKLGDAEREYKHAMRVARDTELMRQEHMRKIDNKRQYCLQRLVEPCINTLASR